MLYYSDKADSLFSVDGISDDIHSVSVPQEGIVRLQGLLACNEYAFRAQVMRPIISKLGAISRHLTKMGKTRFI
jgi:hypothetical protein